MTLAFGRRLAIIALMARRGEEAGLLWSDRRRRPVALLVVSLISFATGGVGVSAGAEPSQQPGGGGATVQQLPGRLPWVNPARCHAACSYHPGAALVRVNNVGQADARGRHQLDVSAVGPLQELLLAARTAGHTMRIASGFRSYADQARLFRKTKEKGRAARPGHSEHQLGTAVDLRLPSTAAVVWLSQHALDHGFAVSYPPGKQRITGYRPEPWHLRFVGAHVAAELRRAGATLEELFRARPELAESGTCADCPTAASRRPCGRTGQRGTCAGDVLVWCYEGALAMVDCAAFKQTCGQPPGSPAPDCVADAADAAEAAGADIAAAAPAELAGGRGDAPGDGPAVDAGPTRGGQAEGRPPRPRSED